MCVAKLVTLFEYGRIPEPKTRLITGSGVQLCYVITLALVRDSELGDHGDFTSVRASLQFVGLYAFLLRYVVKITKSSVKSDELPLRATIYLMGGV